MGLVSSRCLEYVTFDRSELDDNLKSRTLSIVRSVLALQTQGLNPDHIWRRWEVHHTVFPNGYVLTHFKLRIVVLRDVEVTHRFSVTPGGPGLAPAEYLLKAAFASPCPYPSGAFLAYSCPDPDVHFSPVQEENRDEYERAFRIRFPRAQREYDYQWMCGDPTACRLAKPRDFFVSLVSDKALDRVEILLRLHRSLGTRAGDPRLTGVPPSDDLDEYSDEELESVARAGFPPHSVEETPLYRCFHFSAVPVSRGVNLAVVY